MNRKYFLFILQFLTSICIVSVGFASWTIVSGVSIEESGTISAEDVHTNDKYIEYLDCIPFKYYNTGFVNYDDNNGHDVVGTEGNLTFNYKIKLDACLAAYNANKDGSTENYRFKLKFTLSHSSVSNGNDGYYIIIKEDYLKVKTDCSVSVINNTTTGANTYIPTGTLSYSFELTFDNTCVCVIDITNILEEYKAAELEDGILYIDVIYGFSVDSAATFEQYLYPCFIDKNFEFRNRTDVEIAIESTE